MKEFYKGELVTVVDDNDRRIPDYLANGWKERPLTPKPQDEADKRIDTAMREASDSESTTAAKSKGKGKNKKTAPDKKVNDAVEATKNAVEEGEAVDDGLLTPSASGGEANG